MVATVEKKLTYRDSGVDIERANAAVKRIEKLAKSVQTENVIGGIGQFSGFFKISTDYNEPVLVSSTDGVGTKLKIAFMMDKHDTIGIDCVAMCVNDIAVHGATPLFFLDYIATGKIALNTVEDIVRGIINGCQEAQCVLLGGETAEMPGFYKKGEYDIAGFAVGIAERQNLVTGSTIEEGDVIIGVSSSGLHSNGFSLVRNIIKRSGLSLDSYMEELGKTLGEELITPTKIYVQCIKKALKHEIHGMAHITGGGLLENLPRILPPGLACAIDKKSWKTPEIFSLLQKLGRVEDREMFRTFNMGIGLALIVSVENSEKILEEIKSIGETAWIIGQVEKGEGTVKL